VFLFVKAPAHRKNGRASKITDGANWIFGIHYWQTPDVLPSIGFAQNAAVRPDVRQ
jgi:hypothetical protein